jgi:uncharacterized protein YbjT (DUF2867 family)
MAMRTLVTGVSGYVGAELAGRLRADGHHVRGFARSAQRVSVPVDELVLGDVTTGAGLDAALDGIDVAYYLIHSMEPSDHGEFSARDRRAAENFAGATREAGVERIVYLGGIEPSGRASRHIGSRMEVEHILMEEAPRSTALRASIVVGAGSPSFRLLVRLVERLRVLPMPGWRRNRTQPIDERDVIEYLARSPQTPASEGRSLDITGPDVLSYGAMIDRIAELMGVGRMPLGFRRSLTPPASAVVSAVTEQPLELVRPLMESLESDILAKDAEEAPRLYGIRPRPFDRAVEHALREWEEHEPLRAR